ncbi:MAG: hypothetical protein SGPRY_006767 [Prymnesium sp.]
MSANDEGNGCLPEVKMKVVLLKMRSIQDQCTQVTVLLHNLQLRHTGICEQITELELKIEGEGADAMGGEGADGGAHGKSKECSPFTDGQGAGDGSCCSWRAYRCARKNGHAIARAMVKIPGWSLAMLLEELCMVKQWRAQMGADLVRFPTTEEATLKRNAMLW